MITLALSKGRIFEETLPLLKAAGIEVLDDPEKSRKLILETNQADVRVLVHRPGITVVDEPHCSLSGKFVRLLVEAARYVLPRGVGDDEARQVFGVLEKVVEEGTVKARGAIPGPDDSTVVPLKKDLGGLPAR